MVITTYVVQDILFIFWHTYIWKFKISSIPQKNANALARASLNGYLTICLQICLTDTLALLSNCVLVHHLVDTNNPEFLPNVPHPKLLVNHFPVNLYISMNLMKSTDKKAYYSCPKNCSLHLTMKPMLVPGSFIKSQNISWPIMDILLIENALISDRTFVRLNHLSWEVFVILDKFCI